MYQNNQAVVAPSEQCVTTVTEKAPQNLHWTTCFNQDFELKKAFSREDRDRVFRLRHQVYCEELAYEPVSPSGLELDDYDRRSIHCLLQHRRTGESAGTLRLIASNNDAELLPIEHYFKDEFTQPDLVPSAFDREAVSEFSRLAVAASFRRNIQSQQNPILSQVAAVSDSDTQTHYRYISAGLYLAALEQARLLNLKHAYVAVAPALARMLNRVGFQFQQISNPIELNGKRAAYYLDIDKCIHTLCDDYRVLWRVLATQLQNGAFEHYKL